jgi:hypothetical protein
VWSAALEFSGVGDKRYLKAVQEAPRTGQLRAPARMSGQAWKQTAKHSIRQKSKIKSVTGHLRPPVTTRGGGRNPETQWAVPQRSWTAAEPAGEYSRKVQQRTRI